MTQIGEGVHVASASDEEVDDLYFLRFQLVDENAKPIKNIPFKTVKSGQSADPLHIADGRTAPDGKTPIVSTIKDEEIDFYLVWAKLKVNKGFFKM